MQQGALRACLLAAAVAATSWHAGYAFSPMGPLPSLSRLGPRGGAGSPGLQMSAEQSGQPQAVEETRADRPGASKPLGSKRAWLKRKVLAGSALLSVSLSTPQPSGAFDLSEHAGAKAREERPQTGKDRIHAEDRVVVAWGKRPNPEPEPTAVERLKAEMTTFLAMTRDKAGDLASGTAQGTAAVAGQTVQFAGRAADGTAQLASKTADFVAPLAAKTAEESAKVASKAASSTTEAVTQTAIGVRKFAAETAEGSAQLASKTAEAVGPICCKTVDATKVLAGKAAEGTKNLAGTAADGTAQLASKAAKGSSALADKTGQQLAALKAQLSPTIPETVKGRQPATQKAAPQKSKTTQEVKPTSSVGHMVSSAADRTAKAAGEAAASASKAAEGAVTSLSAAAAAGSAQLQACDPATRSVGGVAVASAAIGAVIVTRGRKGDDDASPDDPVTADSKAAPAVENSASSKLISLISPPAATQAEKNSLEVLITAKEKDMTANAGTNMGTRAPADVQSATVFTDGTKTEEMPVGGAGKQTPEQQVDKPSTKTDQEQALEDFVKVAAPVAEATFKAGLWAAGVTFNAAVEAAKIANEKMKEMQAEAAARPEDAAKDMGTQRPATKNMGTQRPAAPTSTGSSPAKDMGTQKPARDFGTQKMDLTGFDVGDINALLDGIKSRSSDSLERRLLGDKEGDEAAAAAQEIAELSQKVEQLKEVADAAGKTNEAGTFTLRLDAIMDAKRAKDKDADIDPAPTSPGPPLPTKTLGRGMSGLKDMTDLLTRAPAEGLDKFAFPEDAVAAARQPVVASCSKAGRANRRPKVNQDGILQATLKNSGVDVWAVFDGHGPEGEKVARWLAQNIPKTLDSTLDGDSSAVGGFVTDAVPAVFEILDADLSNDLGVDLATMSGATATIALHKGGKLLVAGVGDTRAILGGPEKDKIQIMTAKHNPADPVEKSRIQRMGGEVKVFPDEPPIAETGQGRVFARGDWSPGLAVARAFGDLSAKVVGVVVTPDIRTADTAAAVDEGGNGQVLIIASDGVWDVIDDATAMQLCLTYAARKDAKAAAQTLVDTAREVWEAVVEDSSVAIDDISAVVAFL